jgi:hypothetical protein
MSRTMDFAKAIALANQYIQQVISIDKLSMCVHSPFISNESPEKPIEIKDYGNM